MDPEIDSSLENNKPVDLSSPSTPVDREAFEGASTQAEVLFTMASPHYSTIEWSEDPNITPAQQVMSEGLDQYVLNLCELLPEETDLYREVKEIVDEVCELVGHPDLIQEIRIYNSEAPNLSILKTTRKIYMTTGFLKSVAYSRNKVFGALAHEVGHAFYHDLPFLTDDGVILHDSASFTKAAEIHLDRFEEEYCADHMTVVLMTRANVDPMAMVEAHTDIEDYMQEMFEGSRTRNLGVMSTHPMTKRRKQQLKFLRRVYFSGQSRKDKTLSQALKSDCVRRNPKLSLYKESMTLMHRLQVGKKIKPEELINNEVTFPNDIIWASDLSDLSLPSDTMKWWYSALWLLTDECEQEDLIGHISTLNHAELDHLIFGLNPTSFFETKTEIDGPGNKDGHQAMVFLMRRLMQAHFDLSPKSGEAYLLDLFEKASEYVSRHGAFLPVVLASESRLQKAILEYWDVIPLDVFKRYGFVAQGLVSGNLLESTSRRFSARRTVSLDEKGRTYAGTVILRPSGDAAVRRVNSEGQRILEIGADYVRQFSSLESFASALLAYDISASEFEDGMFEIKGIYELVQECFDPTKADAMWERLRKGKHVSRGIMSFNEAAYWVNMDSMVFSMGEDEAYAYLSGEKERTVPYVEASGVHKGELENFVWEQTSYSKIFQAMSGRAAVDYLADHYPYPTPYRDQLIFRALGLSVPEHATDVLALVTEVEAVDEPYLLNYLARYLDNPILSLSASQALWSRISSGIPYLDETYLDAALLGVPAHLRTLRLKHILMAYPYACAERDELLRPLIDGAVSKSDVMDLAALYEHPVKILPSKRDFGSVSRTEFLLDGVGHASELDREEVVLYLLGAKSFYSAHAEFFADADFFESYGMDELRESVLYERTTVDSKIMTHRISGVGQAGNRIFQVKEFVFEAPTLVQDIQRASGVDLKSAMRTGMNLSRRDKITVLYELLVGDKGIMSSDRREPFVEQVAELLLRQSNETTEALEPKEREAVKELLKVFFLHCPSHKLPSLFHDIWVLMGNQQGLSLPESLARVMQSYGGVMIKVGQYLANQSTSIPLRWRHAFRALSDENKHGDKVLLYELTEQSYGGRTPLKEIGKKLAEGSMAAVYESELHDGSKAAYKKRHPWLVRELDEDIKLLEAIVHCVNTTVRGGERLFKFSLPVNLPNVMRRQMEEECSMKRERENARALSEGLSQIGSRIVTPKYFDDLVDKNGVAVEVSDEGVLMELIRACAIDDDAAIEAMGLSPLDLKKEVALSNLKLMLSGLPYHADLNPGNILVRNSESPIVFIDPGTIGHLSPAALIHLKGAIAGIFSPFEDKTSVVTSFLCGMMDGLSPTDEAGVSDWVEAQKAQTMSLSRLNDLVNEFLDYCLDRGWEIQEEWVQCFRAIGLMTPYLETLETSDLVELYPFIASS